MPKMNRCWDQRKTRNILRKVEIVIRLLSDMVIGTHFQTSSSDESRVLLANLVKKPLQNPFREIFYLGLSAIFWVLNYQHEIIYLWHHKDLCTKVHLAFCYTFDGANIVHQFIEYLLTAKKSYAMTWLDSETEDTLESQNKCVCYLIVHGSR